MFFQIDVLKNFANFTRKQLCWSLLFNKVAGLRLATSLKKRLKHRCFPVKFAKFLKTTFFTEHFWWLFLILSKTVINTTQNMKFSIKDLVNVTKSAVSCGFGHIY